MIIRCPFCGPRGHDEFSPLGAAGLRAPAPDAPLAAWTDHVYRRDNPKGPHDELWQHAHGCRAFLVVRRDTATHEILDVRPARVEEGT